MTRHFGSHSEKGLRVFKVPGVEVGDVVELVTLRVYRDARWLQPLQMNGRIPVVRAEVVLDAPDGFFDLDMRVMREGQVQTLPIQSFFVSLERSERGRGEGEKRKVCSWHKCARFYQRNSRRRCPFWRLKFSLL